MVKILSGTFIVALILIILIFGFGIRKGPNVQADLTVYLPYSQEYIYSIFTDISKYPERKRNLDNIEVLEISNNSILRWRENYANGSWVEYEVLEKVDPVIFDYKIYRSSNNHTAEINTTFSEEEDFTEIVLTEDGTIPNSFKRGLRFLSTESSYLKSQIKWLRVAILDNQISRQ